MRFFHAFVAVMQLSIAAAQITDSMLSKTVEALTLKNSFNPIKSSYWTGYPHHRRTPFAVSPDGKTAYLAYLDASETDVHIQSVDPTTFNATGVTVTVTGAKEAGGLVAHNDGFAVLINKPLPSGTANAPPDNTPVAALARFDASGTQKWETYLGGPNIDADNDLASPDMNGDLVFSEKAGYYAAYIVVTAYSGPASGHFGDAIRYINTEGKLTTINGASSSWGCSHNTGIAFEAADAPPYASICAEDQGAVWLNTETQSMTNNGVKISNEHVINGASNEPMGGMSGSFSGLARFGGANASSNKYIFAWVSRGAIDLTENTWMGSGYTKAENRTVARNVAIATMSDKKTLIGKQATSVVGAKDGDSQINWVTSGSADCQNAHAATFDDSNALITWEQIDNPECYYDAMGCKGQFSGTFYQQVDSSGKKLGEPLKSMDSFVAGDMVTMDDGRICWPYVAMDWNLDTTADTLNVRTTKMSFACIGLSGSGSSPASAAASSASASRISSAASSGTPQVSSVSSPFDSATSAITNVVSTTPSASTEKAPSSAVSSILTKVEPTSTFSTSTAQIPTTFSTIAGSGKSSRPYPKSSTCSKTTRTVMATTTIYV
ncbi:hypothetical protein TD95_002308 [Thielaviopsis punctulata]|uniref:Uncharacterized protein n=1 Tax=Thielaviopsis punctulata TaxID=72032 RepID=A0A0F4ZB14_9PEZI|nr:hypothetical protein TD95_002308 [Thielaviopsis punctulata]